MSVSVVVSFIFLKKWPRIKVEKGSRETIEIMLSNSCACWFRFGIATLSRTHEDMHSIASFYHNSRERASNTNFITIAGSYVGSHRIQMMQVDSCVESNALPEFIRTGPEGMRCMWINKVWKIENAARCLSMHFLGIESIGMKPNVTWLNLYFGWSKRSPKCTQFKYFFSKMSLSKRPHSRQLQLCYDHVRKLIVSIFWNFVDK